MINKQKIKVHLIHKDNGAGAFFESFDRSTHSEDNSFEMNFRFHSAIYGGDYYAYIEYNDKITKEDTDLDYILMYELVEAIYKKEKYKGDLDNFLKQHIYLVVSDKAPDQSLFNGGLIEEDYKACQAWKADKLKSKIDNETSKIKKEMKGVKGVKI